MNEQGWYIGPYKDRRDASIAVEGTPLRVVSDKALEVDKDRPERLFGWVFSGLVTAVVIAFAAAPAWWALSRVWKWAL